MVGNLSVGDQIRENHIRFRNITDYEAYINAIVEGFDSDYSIFNGYFHKLKAPQFNLVNRSQYGNGCDLKHQIIEDRENNCFIPSNGYCCINCINFLTGEDYKQQYPDFIRNEQRRSNIMSMARIQPCLRKLGFNLGSYKGKEIWPRKKQKEI